MSAAKPVTKPFLSFKELCERWKCSAQELHAMIAECQIAPAIIWPGPLIMLDAKHSPGEERPTFTIRPSKPRPAEQLLSRQYGISFTHQTTIKSSQWLYALYPQRTGAFSYQFSTVSTDSYGHPSPDEQVWHGLIAANGDTQQIDQTYIEHQAVFLAEEITRAELRQITENPDKDAISTEEHQLLHTLVFLAKVVFQRFSLETPYSAAGKILSKTGAPISQDAIAGFLKKIDKSPSETIPNFSPKTRNIYYLLIYSLAATTEGFKTHELEGCAKRICANPDAPIGYQQLLEYLIKGKKEDDKKS
jgi:hypothetical protein